MTATVQQFYERAAGSFSYAGAPSWGSLSGAQQNAWQSALTAARAAADDTAGAQAIASLVSPKSWGSMLGIERSDHIFIAQFART